MSDEIELIPEEIEQLKKSSSPIPVIKALVQRTGCGLIQAREAVERVGRKLKMYEDGTCPHCHGTGRSRRWGIFRG